MSSGGASTTLDHRLPSKEACEPFDSTATGPGGAGEPDAAAPPSHFSSRFREAIFILVIGLSQLFSVGGLGITAFSVQHIGHALDVTSNAQTSWFSAAYSLCGGVFVLVRGRLGDHFGHKYVFIFGWI